MIISRTPFRISFAGGGSDFYEYYRKEGGAVLSTSINKYVYLSMLPSFNNGGYHLKYFNNEVIDNVDDIKHPIIKSVFKKYKISGVDFNSSSDVPSGTGLGSSSSFTVGLINLCCKYAGIRISKHEMAKMACDIEINELMSPIGKQDQYSCSLGGMNYIEFNSDESVNVTPVLLSSEQCIRLEKSLILYYVGNTRSARSVLTEQKNNIENNFETLKKITNLAKALYIDLQFNNTDNFGEILHAGWEYKKELSSNITNSVVDDIYSTALRRGAVGGKLLGAGMTGFMLLYAPHGLTKELDLYRMPFSFENMGTTIL